MFEYFTGNMSLMFIGRKFNTCRQFEILRMKSNFYF